MHFWWWPSQKWQGLGNKKKNVFWDYFSILEHIATIKDGKGLTKYKLLSNKSPRRGYTLRNIRTYIRIGMNIEQEKLTNKKGNSILVE